MWNFFMRARAKSHVNMSHMLSIWLGQRPALDNLIPCQRGWWIDHQSEYHYLCPAMKIEVTKAAEKDRAPSRAHKVQPLFTLAVFLFAFSTTALAQVQTVSRTANGQPDSDIRVGVYVNIKPDCTSGPLPAIQLTSPPEHGKVTVKQGKVTATNYKQCLAVEVPAFIAFYRSRSDFAGVDVMTLSIKYPGGKTEVQRISVTVGTGGPGKGV
jgi:hypothetical protein